eukprot:symbB.v1.2.024997.t1/scaffold2404.1/size80018/1
MLSKSAKRRVRRDRAVARHSQEEARAASVAQQAEVAVHARQAAEAKAAADAWAAEASEAAKRAKGKDELSFRRPAVRQPPAPPLPSRKRKSCDVGDPKAHEAPLVRPPPVLPPPVEVHGSWTLRRSRTKPGTYYWLDENCGRTFAA